MKRLVFCFDGTWNRLDSECPTNVVITAESTLPLAADNTAQLIYYDEGVGTGKWDRIRGGMFGAGLVQNLADAYRFLIFNHTPGDEIYVFGFSRGAYTARSFVGLLSNCGILRRRDAARVKESVERYKSRDTSSTYLDKMMEFRRECSPHLCVSQQEDEWRASKVPGYSVGQLPRLAVRYLGVWDTVGALGIPKSFSWLNLTSKKHQFHDTSLSGFVQSARHAVAIDERRNDFAPTLWENLEALNKREGKPDEAYDAPYQQKWFPGTHSSVGGGGERRGLSDHALDWVLDGARHMGLQLDAGKASRIYELAPNYAEYIENSAKNSLMYRTMNLLSAGDRLPGPANLFEVSISARRRWQERPENLSDRKAYRPRTLAAVSAALDSLPPIPLETSTPASPQLYDLHEVKMGDTLSALALHYYGSAGEWKRIFAANLNKLDDPDHIYVGQLLKITRR